MDMKCCNRIFFCLLMSFLGLTSQAQEQPVMVNQMGYNTYGPKRFTAPLTKNGTFTIRFYQKDQQQLFRGKIKNYVGDFTSFHPEDITKQYVVHTRDPEGRQGISFPFSIGLGWQEAASFAPALDFMIDSRSIVGSHPSAVGGTPWRDGTYYSFEVPSLILQLMANPSVYLNRPATIHYAADKKKVLNPDFSFIVDPKFLTDQQREALVTLRKYYTTLDPPVGKQVPDIIQLIHFGIGFYLINPVNRDPSRDTASNRSSSTVEKIHPQTLEQFAFFLYAFPLYKQYFSKRFYQQAYDLAFRQWRKVGLFDVIAVIGSGKGREAPGHSILPNLMMYEVAKRTGRSDAEAFFNAAFNQAKWVIDEVDWHNPQTTKGQRMSEHKTMPGLVYFLRKYPDRAPKGLQRKVEEWAKIMIRRSDNMWDFRRYDTIKNWSIPKYNEPGNLAGFTASALAAASQVKEQDIRERLTEIGYASLDNLFGRNPLNAASPDYPKMGFPYLEKGWPKIYPANLCGRLETCRGTLNSSCNTSMYPYHPESKAFAHAEGWVAFNAAWNVSLAYLSYYDTRLRLMKQGTGSPLKVYQPGAPLYVELQAPLNINNHKKETGTIRLSTSDGRSQKLEAVETGPHSGRFRVQVPGKYLSASKVGENQEKIKWIMFSYGYGLFRKEIRLIRKGSRYRVQTPDRAR